MVIIQIKQDRVFGEVKNYPDNIAAMAACELLKQRTLTKHNLVILERMGCEIIYTTKLED